MLAVQNVSKTYLKQSQPAVNQISFDLQEGKILAIVGESGSGKTTLLKMIAGLEDADKGYLYLNNKQILGSDYRLVRGHKQIKLLQQDFNLLPRHKIYENIAYYLRLYAKEEQEQRITELLTWCNLQDVADKYPSELSGGQQQRAALAVALADEPLLLLLDEPFSHLDRQLKLRLRQETKQILNKANITAILVTHDIEDAFYLADSMAIMQNGSVLQIDTPQNIYENPKNSYIAALIGYHNILYYKDLATIITNYDSNLSEKLILLKPDTLSITPQNKSSVKPNAIVKECIFLGSYYEVTIIILREIIGDLKEILLTLHMKEKIAIATPIYLAIDEKNIYFFGNS